MEPTATASGASAVAAGAAAAFVSIVGVDAQSLFWGTVGSSIGIPATEPTSRVRAAFVFVASTLACALLARWLAYAFFGGHDLARNGMSLGLAMFFPLLKQQAAAHIPAVVGAVLRAFKVAQK